MCNFLVKVVEEGNPEEPPARVDDYDPNPGRG